MVGRVAEAPEALGARKPHRRERRAACLKFQRQWGLKVDSSGADSVKCLQTYFVQWGVGSTLASGFQLFVLAQMKTTTQTLQSPNGYKAMHHIIIGNILLLQTMLVLRKRLGKECYLYFMWQTRQSLQCHWRLCEEWMQHFQSSSTLAHVRAVSFLELTLNRPTSMYCDRPKRWWQAGCIQKCTENNLQKNGKNKA